jgi:putative membrane protein
MSKIRTARRCAGLAVASGLAATAVVAAAPAATADPAGTDASFLVQVHQANLTEISASENARAASTSACVRAVADILVRDHRRLDAAGGQLAARLGVRLPSAPTPDQQRLLAELAAANGTAGFDGMWLRAQVTAHQDALNLLDGEIAHGVNPSVVRAARTARPVVASHLVMVRDGVCHAPSMAATVNAGDGGQAAADGQRSAAGALLGLGALTVAVSGGVAARRQGAAHSS